MALALLPVREKDVALARLGGGRGTLDRRGTPGSSEGLSASLGLSNAKVLAIPRPGGEPE